MYEENGPLNGTEIHAFKQGVKRQLQRQRLIEEATREFEEENFPFRNDSKREKFFEAIKQHPGGEELVDEILTKQKAEKPEVSDNDGLKPFLTALTGAIEDLTKKIEASDKRLIAIAEVVHGSNTPKKRGPYKKRAVSKRPDMPA